MNASHRALLGVKNATRNFGGLAAVDNVSFDLQQGHITGLIGPNGAGKSTMFNLITGVIPVSSGEIYFNGARIDALPPHTRSPMGLARTFQIVRLFDGLTVLENVMLGHHPRMPDGILRSLLKGSGLRSLESESRRDALRQLEFVGLAERAQEPISDLSLGQQRLVDIARALASKPRLLLLDEPAAGLNDAETDNLAGILASLKATGTTILLVEHDVEFIMNLCDRIVVMDHGSKIAEGDPETIRSNAAVIEAYLGTREAHAHD
jgi:ABC-type branched-subunit amino acid transport system ATPase component